MDKPARLPHHSFLSRLYTGNWARFEVIGRSAGCGNGNQRGVIVGDRDRQHPDPRIHLRHRPSRGAAPRCRSSAAMRTVSQSSRSFRKEKRWATTRNPWSWFGRRLSSANRADFGSEDVWPNDKDRKASQLRCSTSTTPRGRRTVSPASLAISGLGRCPRRGGGQITKKAVIALVVFWWLVSLYITVRYEERYMAISAR